MSIKQQGGVFGRNPTFNDVTIEGQLTFDGDIDINSDLKVDGDLDVTGSALIGTTTANTTYAPRLYTESALSDGDGGILIGSYKPSATFLDFSGGTPAVHRIANDGGNLYFETDTNQDGTFDTVGAHFTSVGNLAFESGKGIDFSATAGTGTSELLDDYEEGYVTGITMTPSTSGTITMLAAYTTLSYTKVGRIVTITGNLVTSSSSSPVGTSVAIGTLPFTVAAGDQTAFAAGNAVTYYEGGGVYSSTPIRVTESATAITWLIDASTVSGVKELYINLSYVAA